MPVHGCSSFRSRIFSAIVLAGLLPVLSGLASAQRYHQFNIISDVPGVANTTDTLGQLVNPWGIAFSATGPFWISDNGSGLSTLYAGPTPITQQGLVVTVPPAPGNAGGTPTGSFIYATNFRDRKVEVYDSNFAYVKSFRDQNVPSNYAPFGIQAIGQKIYVTYAQQDDKKHDDVKGDGHGFVDVFGPHGALFQRLVSQ